jgi:hypothetical protein
MKQEIQFGPSSSDHHCTPCCHHDIRFFTGNDTKTRHLCRHPKMMIDGKQFEIGEKDETPADCPYLKNSLKNSCAD